MPSAGLNPTDSEAFPMVRGDAASQTEEKQTSQQSSGQREQNLEAVLPTLLEALGHQKAKRKKLEAPLNNALIQESATERAEVKALLEKVAAAEVQMEEALADLRRKATTYSKHDLEALVDVGAKPPDVEVEPKALPEAAKPAKVETEPEEESYDLQDRKAFAKFLIDADIRLVRGRFFKKLYRDGLKLPRRQEADSMTVGFIPALVRHEEVEIWAEAEEVEEKTQDLDYWEIAERKAARQAKIVAVSHVWESREHADPHGYQLRKLAEVVEADAWYFYDYMSLYQFKRKVASQEKSFRRAMANMHVLYAHEHSSTLRIESLTPLDEMHMDATVLVYHAPSDEVKPVPVANLIANQTAYRDRGWCIAERCWSSTRSLGSLSKEIDEAEADTEGQAPMPPEIFVPLFKEKLQFTHRSDMDAVLKLQERVFHEKAQKNEILKLEKLSRAEAEVAIQALPHYPVLRRLDITGSRLGDSESFLLALFKALDSKSSITELCLADNELGVKGAMFVIRKVLDKNPPLSMLELKKNGITEEGANMLAEALLQHPDAALKIELDGNNLGAGALILALALKICQVQATLVHPSVELLAKRMQVLDFKKAILDEACQALADGRSKLLHLTSLSLILQSNNVGDQVCQLLADGLSKLLQLTSLTLVLRYNNVCAEGCRSLADGLSKLVQLTTLSVNLQHNSGGECRNNVGVGGCRALGDGLSKLAQLTSLSLILQGNNLGPEGCRSLTDGLSKLLQLTSLSLNLRHNKVGAEGCQSLGDGLSKLLQLTSLSLNLEKNNVDAEGCQSLGDGLSKLIQLTSLTLVLRYNNVCAEGCRSLADGLSKLVQLTTLSVNLQHNSGGECRNNVGVGGCRALGDGLSKLLKLTSLSLNLYDTNVGDQGCQLLADGLSKLLQLTSLSLKLNSNSVGAKGCRSLTDGLSKLLQLTSLFLTLTNNKVGAEGCRSLADGLSKLLKLTSLSLDLCFNKVVTAEVHALKEKLQHVAELKIVNEY